MNKPYRIIRGDLLEAKEKYLAHQTNCVTNRAAHLSAAVFDAFPFADIYSERRRPSRPGTIVIRGDGKKERFVINMLGQVFPGAPGPHNPEVDGGAKREDYFDRCLEKISKITELETVAFPHRIGCGAAGGDWPAYREMLKNFAAFVHKDQGARVVVYRLPED